MGFKIIGGLVLMIAASVAIVNFLRSKTDNPDSSGNRKVGYELKSREYPDRSLNSIAGSWKQRGEDIDGEKDSDRSGQSIAMSNDGTRIAIGAPENRYRLGHVRVYDWTSLGSEFGWQQTSADIESFSDGRDEFDDYLGYSVAMSGDGLRLIVGGPNYSEFYSDNYCDSDYDGPDCEDKYEDDYLGYAKVYQFEGGGWRLTNTFSGKDDFDHQGISVSISDNGERVVTLADGNGLERIVVYEYGSGGIARMPTPTEDVFDNAQEVVMAGNGEVLAVAAPSCSEEDGSFGKVYLYAWQTSVWTLIHTFDGDISSDCFGLSVDLSQNGERVAIAARGTVRVFERDEDRWTRLGNDISGDPLVFADIGLARGRGRSVVDDGSSVSISKTGNRLLVGNPSENLARVYEFSTDSGSWIRVGNDIISEDERNEFGYATAMNADGSIIAIAGPHIGNQVRVYEFDDGSEESGPFPPAFEKVTCAYQWCLNNLINELGSPLTTFGNETLDVLVTEAHTQAKWARNQIKKKGNPVTSMYRLKEAMSIIYELQWKAAGQADVLGFTQNIGEYGSSCGIEYIEDYVGAFQGTGLLPDFFLSTVKNTFLEKAKKYRNKKKWKKSAIFSLRAIRSLTNKLGEKYIPKCGG